MIATLMGDRRVSRPCWECDLLLTVPEKGCQTIRYNLRSQSKKGIKREGENALNPSTVSILTRRCGWGVCVYVHLCNSAFVLWLLLTLVSEDKHASEFRNT